METVWQWAKWRANSLMMYQKRLCRMRPFILFLILAAVAGLSTIGALSEPNRQQVEATDTPTPELNRSLFEDDFCVAPCWFGLVAGESTSLDVRTFLRANQDLFRGGAPRDMFNNRFDPETDILVDGQYAFFFNDYEREDSIQRNGSIVIEDSVVLTISALMNRFVTLEEVLATYGLPDEVVFAVKGYGTFHLDLLYYDKHLKVEVMSSSFLSTWRPDICLTGSLGESFWVAFVRYYASPEAMEYETVLTSLEPRGLDVEGIVPPELWEAYFVDSAQVDCREALWAIQGLPAIPAAEA